MLWIFLLVKNGRSQLRRATCTRLLKISGTQSNSQSDIRVRAPLWNSHLFSPGTVPCSWFPILFDEAHDNAPSFGFGLAVGAFSVCCMMEAEFAPPPIAIRT